MKISELSIVFANDILLKRPDERPTLQHSDIYHDYFAGARISEFIHSFKERNSHFKNMRIVGQQGSNPFGSVVFSNGIRFVGEINRGIILVPADDSSSEAENTFLVLLKEFITYFIDSNLPINGVGVNFEVAMPANFKLNNLFASEYSTLMSEETSIRYLEFGKPTTLEFTTQNMRFEMRENGLTMVFNFHSPISSANKKVVLEAVLSNFSKYKSLAEGAYDEFSK